MRRILTALLIVVTFTSCYERRMQRANEEYEARLEEIEAENNIYIPVNTKAPQ